MTIHARVRHPRSLVDAGLLVALVGPVGGWDVEFMLMGGNLT